MLPKQSREFGRKLGFKKALIALLSMEKELSDDVFDKIVVNNIPREIGRTEGEEEYEEYAMGVTEGVEQVFTALRNMVRAKGE